ncbi:MAG TPA: protein kinase, partial [Terriglobia bacterium]|nr:protein kinase [Terriglobia bacterium]
MTDRWEQINRLYYAALEVETKERARFLEESCPGDSGVRAEVETLLAMHEKAGEFLGSPAIKEVAQQITVEPPSLVGRQLGPYQILGLLGRGGMGEVYRARDTRLDRIGALKILPVDVASDPERLRRFVREAKAASALNHPNIATIYEIGESDGIHWISMELVEGETLAERIAIGADPRFRPRVGAHGGAPLQIETILDIGIQVADALAEAHSKGITHRDIKPANLMLTPKGQLKVLDFGLAKITRVEGQAVAMVTSTDSQTFPGLVMGTARYMSPEQVLGQLVDHRTDIFSLGVVLYEMVTGQSPFAGETPSAIFESILHQAPSWPPRAQVTVPGELERIINKSLEKFREVRYQTALDLLTDLKRLKHDTDSGESVAYPAALGRILRGWNQKRWITVAALLTVLIVLLWWFLSRQKSEVIREPMRIVPFTTLPGMEFDPKFSPDGKFVAFNWNGPAPDNFDIYVRQVDGEGQLRLTSDPADDCCPAWSPDGREIAFVRDLGEVASIYTVPSLGGAERKLYELRGPSGLTYYLSWSPDGHWLAFSEKSARESPYGIFLLSLDTRQKIPLTSPPPDSYGDFSPEFSPDGKRMAFVRVTQYGVCDIWVQPVPSGEATRLTNGNYEGIFRLAWTADGREVVFSATGGIFRVPLSGGVPQGVAGIGENASAPTIWGNHM